MGTDVRFSSCGLFSPTILCFGTKSTALAFFLLGHTTELLPMTNACTGHEPCANHGCCAKPARLALHWRTNAFDVIGNHRLHTACPLFSLELLNCGRWRQMLLNATLELRLVPHMPLVTEIIGATPRPSSCTPLIPQPKPGSTSAWRLLRFPLFHPDSREYGNTMETNT